MTAIGTMGEVLVEFLCEERDTGHSRPSRYLGPFASGAPAIFAAQAARQGVRSVLCGAVGEDAFGTLVAARLAAEGVDCGLLEHVAGWPTGTAFVAYEGGGGRRFVFNIARSAALRLPEPEAVLAGMRGRGVRLFHISGSALGPPGLRAAVMLVARGLRDSGVALSVDPNVRPDLALDRGFRAALDEALALAAHVFPSEEDAAALWPGEGFGLWSDRLLANGAESVVLTRGAEGAVARIAGGTALSIAGHRLEAIDPTGAGDCFAATFLSARLEGADPAEALARANAAGALAVLRAGPMEGITGPAEVAARLGRAPA